MVTRTSSTAHRLSNVVAVLVGSSLKCLRKDVATDLVFEVRATAPRGLPTTYAQAVGGHVGTVWAGGLRGQNECSEKVAQTSPKCTSAIKHDVGMQ